MLSLFKLCRRFSKCIVAFHMFQILSSRFKLYCRSWSCIDNFEAISPLIGTWEITSSFLKLFSYFFNHVMMSSLFKLCCRFCAFQTISVVFKIDGRFQIISSNFRLYISSLFKLYFSVTSINWYVRFSSCVGAIQVMFSLFKLYRRFRAFQIISTFFKIDGCSSRNIVVFPIISWRPKAHHHLSSSSVAIASRINRLVLASR